MFFKTTEYALRAVIYIAQKSSEEHKLSLTAIAKAIDSPASFTAKILQQLTRDNYIVSSVRGPRGGFYMTAASKQLPAAAVLQALGEAGLITKCVLGLKQCSEAKPCPLHHDYKPIKEQLMQLFANKTIAEMAGEVDTGQAVVSNRKARKNS